MVFDSLFQESLQKSDIQAKTAVRYTDLLKNQVSDSSSDSLFYQKSYATAEVIPTFFNEFSIRGFIDITPYTVFRYKKGSFIFLTLSLLFVAILLVHRIVKKSHLMKKGEKEKNEAVVMLTEGLYYNRITMLLFQGEKQVSFSSIIGDVFLSLLEAGEEGRTRDELITLVWGGAPDESKQNSLNRAINTIRQKIAPFSLELVTVRRMGFRLKIKEDDSIPKKSQTK